VARFTTDQALPSILLPGEPSNALLERGGDEAKGGNVSDGEVDTPRLEVLRRYFAKNKILNE